MSVATPEKIELRCPYGPKQLLLIVTRNGDYHGMSADGLTMDITCRDCAKKARKTDPSVRRAIHKFNILGQLVDTELQRDT